jgi:CRP-like cAMP-binding protein
MDESELRSIPLFQSLTSEERRAIAPHADEIDVPEGTELVRQGEFAYEFFVIEEGTAEVNRDGEHVAELGPGDFLG